MPSPSAVDHRHAAWQDQRDEDVGLLTNFFAGDGAGLFQKYQPLIIGYLRRHLQDEATVDDIAQQVWQSVFTKGHTIRKQRAFREWLFSTAHNTMVNYAVRRRRTYSMKEGSDSLTAPDGNPLTFLLFGEQRNQVHRVLGQLVPMDSEVLDLFYLKGMKLKEIASQLSEREHRMMPMGTVKRRLHVARKRFGERFRSIYS